MTMILLGRKRAKKRRNPHFSTRRKWCEKWLGAPSDDATASLEIVGESSETAKMMMTANLWCWGRKKYRQSMLCARQVACVLRERTIIQIKSLIYLTFYGSMNFCFSILGWNVSDKSEILPENIFNYLEEGLNFTKVWKLPFVKRDFHFHIDAAVFDMHF